MQFFNLALFGAPSTIKISNTEVQKSQLKKSTSFYCHLKRQHCSHGNKRSQKSLSRVLFELEMKGKQPSTYSYKELEMLDKLIVNIVC